jgi:hypothetical protein
MNPIERSLAIMPLVLVVASGVAISGENDDKDGVWRVSGYFIK